MNTGKTLFAQLMEFLPWKTFSRVVTRYGGDTRVRTLSCAEQYRAMAFAQLSYRESLRDIEVCLSTQAGKLYHMGFREPVRRSTLADANEGRDWRIYADFAQRLIGQPRVCGRWTHALESISFFRGLWRGRFRACVYAVTAVPGASVTASSRFGIGIPSFFSNSAQSPAIFVR
jgi:hypothetical protein